MQGHVGQPYLQLDCAVALPHTRVVVDDITKGMPTHDTSLKWLKVTVSTQKCFHTFQEGYYSIINPCLYQSCIVRILIIQLKYTISGTKWPSLKWQMHVVEIQHLERWKVRTRNWRWKKSTAQTVMIGRFSFIAAIYNYFELSGVQNGSINSKISCGA